jgi:hypothetical protein
MEEARDGALSFLSLRASNTLKLTATWIVRASRYPPARLARRE